MVYQSYQNADGGYAFQAYNDKGVIPETFLNSKYNKNFNTGMKECISPVIIEEPVFMLRYQWENNYQHFITEVLPKLNVYFSLRESVPAKILIRDLPFIHQLILPLVDENDIIIQKEDVLMKECYFTDVKNINFQPIDRKTIELLHRIRDFYSVEKEMKGILYLDRADSHLNQGNNRKITNKEEILDYLRVDTVKLEEMDLKEKTKALSGYHTIITQYGANMMNLVFANNLRRVIFIGSKNFNLNDYLKFTRSLLPGVDLKSFTSKHVENKDVNSPFWISLPEFKRFYSSI